MGINMHEFKEFHELHQVNKAFVHVVCALNMKLPHNFKGQLKSHYYADETFEEAAMYGNLPGRIMFWTMKKNIMTLLQMFDKIADHNPILKEGVKLRIAALNGNLEKEEA